MKIITLISDMGTRDHYVASVKGQLMTQVPTASIVDITHHIRPFDIAQAAFVLRQTWKDFPQGSIHIIGVSPEHNQETAHLIVQIEGHYFIGADNGVFALMFDRHPDEVFELNISQDRDEMTFPTRDLFAKAAAHLARGGTPEVIGKRIKGVKEAESAKPVVERNLIKGRVIHVDGYGNAISNITKKLFSEVRKDREFSIQFKKAMFEITKIHQTYGQVSEGQSVALFGSSGDLEIAVNKGAEGNGGGASKLFGLKVDDIIRVEFYDD